MTNETDTPFLDMSGAPMPTPATLRRRRGIIRQFVAFIRFNLRILRVVRRTARAEKAPSPAD